MVGADKSVLLQDKVFALLDPPYGIHPPSEQIRRVARESMHQPFPSKPILKTYTDCSYLTVDSFTHSRIYSFLITFVSD